MRRFSALVAMVMLVLTSAVLPASANPPERFDETLFNIFPDEKYGLVVFWNITRDDFCDWADDDFMGAPPVIQLVPVQVVETGPGALVASSTATRPLELWVLDEDADLSGPCADTDDQLGPWATGSARVTGNDNDLDVSGTRVNSFGDRSQGTVVDGEGGSWHYSYRFRAHCVVDCDEGFSLILFNTNLKKKGK